MTNYNDGKWHGWNGGVMPVQGRSLIDVVFRCQGYRESKKANSWSWDCPEEPIIAFRVTKEYKEPREYWICQPLYGMSRTLILDREPYEAHLYRKVIHVREVVE